MVGHGESCDTAAGGDGESAECCGGGVVGVTFEGGTEAEEVVDGKGGICEGVEGAEEAEADGDGAAEASGGGYFAVDGPREIEAGAAGFVEESGNGFFSHGLRWCWAVDDFAGGEG